MTDTLPDTHNSASGPQDNAGKDAGHLQGEPRPAGSKEAEGGIRIGAPEGYPFGGKETGLPQEVLEAGVTERNPEVRLPEQVAEAGVRIVDDHRPQPVKTIQVQLTDDEIVRGRKQGIHASWRWLAEFHRRQLLKLGIVLRTIRGAVRRTERKTSYGD